MTITFEGAVGFPKTEAEWAERASRHLKAELKRAGITYDGLANLLKKQGFRDETKASVSSKLARGTFTATFFLASLAAISDARPSDWRIFKTHQKLERYLIQQARQKQK
jgi:hypothetical protein